MSSRASAGCSAIRSLPLWDLRDAIAGILTESGTMHRLPDRLAVEVWPLDIVGPKLGPMRFATLRHPRSIAGAGAFAAAVVVGLAAAVAGIGMLVGAFGPSPATPIAPAVTARLGASIPTSRL